MLFPVKKIPIFQSFKTGCIKKTVSALFLLLYVLFNSVSAVDGIKKSPLLVTKDVSVFDRLFLGKPIVIIRSCKNNKVLDLPGGSKNENSPILFYEANGGTNQLWIIEKVEIGYLIRSLFSKKVLAVNTEFSKEYPLIVQQDYCGKDSQVWLISGKADSLMILNKALQKFLAISSNYLMTENFSGSLSQVWRFQFLRDAQKEAVSCDCSKNFEYIRNLIETSYPGFQDKVNPQTKAQYEQLRKRMVEKASFTKKSANCFKIIDQYLSFFKDNHIQFSMQNTYEYGFGEKLDPEMVRQFYVSSETVKMGENEVRQYLDNNKGKLSSVEGVWQTQDGINRCAIIRDKKDNTQFVGFILRSDNLYWMPGQVKMNFIQQPDNLFTVYYYRKNHTILKEKNFEFLSCNTFRIENTKWIRIYPDLHEVQSPKKSFAAIIPNGFQLKKMDDSTLLFTFPNCNPENKPLVDNLFKTNKNELLNTPYLIIDMRGNGGGADDTWNSILPFLYTNPYKIVGNDMLSSKENIKGLELLLSDYNKPEDSKAFLRSMIKRMKENPDKLIESFSDGVVRFDAIMPNPRRIAILINNHCGSSAEEFLLRAKESKKVTLFGQPTSGTLDYSNLIPGKFPSSVFSIYYPHTRTRRLYLVDKEKIKPDFYLSNNQDWIGEAVKYLKSAR